MKGQIWPFLMQFPKELMSLLSFLRLWYIKISQEGL